MSQIQDVDLIRDCQLGKKSSFGELVDRYKNRVYTSVFRMVRNSHDAEDIAQETFIAAYRAIGNFDLSKKFAPWLMKIATNLSIDHLRRKGQQIIPLDSAEEVELQINESPLESAEVSELNDLTEQVIAELPPRYRAAITLYYADRLKYDEVADALDIPIGTVKTYLHRGREIMKKRLSNVLC